MIQDNIVQNSHCFRQPSTKLSKKNFSITLHNDLKIAAPAIEITPPNLNVRRRIKLIKKSKIQTPAPAKRILLETFESRLNEKDNCFYVESTLNTPGNYFNYVSNVLKNLKNFDIIDFIPSVMKKSLYLDHTEKKSLFLDLDETLVHADFCYFYNKHDCYLEFNYDDQPVTIPLIIRPHLVEFLDFCSEYFDIYIFTASRKEYADCILNYLERNKKYFKQRFYRDNCVIIKNRIFIKDLRIFLNRNLKDMIIIDNSLFSFANQLSNGILVTSFYCDPNDKELLNLKNYLGNMRLNQVEDIRNVNKKVFNFDSIKERV